jgi:DNA repair exonuclease SbcCD ATPase subunit
MGWDDEEVGQGRSKIEPATMSSEVETFHNLVNKLELDSKSVGGSAAKNAQMNKDREQAKALMRTLHKKLQSPPADIDRNRLAKFEREIKQDTARLTELLKKTIAQNNKEVDRARASSENLGGGGGGGAAGDYGMASPGPQQSLDGFHAVAYTEEEIIREKNQEIRALETDLQEINSLMREVAVLVNDQQTGIDSIEMNVESAGTQVQGGNKELGKALKYAQSSRKKMCCVIVLLMIIGLILALYFGLVGTK